MVGGCAAITVSPTAECKGMFVVWKGLCVIRSVVSRSAAHPGAGALLHVLRHGGLGGPAAAAWLTSCDIQPHFLRLRLQLLRTGPQGMGAERVVSGPARALGARTPGRSCAWRAPGWSWSIG